MHNSPGCFPEASSRLKTQRVAIIQISCSNYYFIIQISCSMLEVTNSTARKTTDHEEMLAQRSSENTPNFCIALWWLHSEDNEQISGFSCDRFLAGLARCSGWHSRPIKQDRYEEQLWPSQPYQKWKTSHASKKARGGSSALMVNWVMVLLMVPDREVLNQWSREALLILWSSTHWITICISPW